MNDSLRRKIKNFFLFMLMGAVQISLEKILRCENEATVRDEVFY